MAKIRVLLSYEVIPGLFQDNGPIRVMEGLPEDAKYMDCEKQLDYLVLYFSSASTKEDKDQPIEVRRYNYPGEE